MKSQITIRTVKFANAVGATLCLVFLSGCGEDLRPKVADLESQLATVKEELAKEKAVLAVSAAKLAAFEKAEAARAAEAASRATLTVQLGLTMKSGDTKPVSNTKVYLTQKSVSELVAGIPLNSNDGESYEGKFGVGWVWSRALDETGRYLYSQFANQANKRLLDAKIAAADTDFNGLAVFEDIPKGEYFVICVTALGGGALLEKKVTISTSKMKTALSNSDTIR
jgi:hypothetical protein